MSWVLCVPFLFFLLLSVSLLACNLLAKVRWGEWSPCCQDYTPSLFKLSYHIRSHTFLSFRNICLSLVMKVSSERIGGTKHNRLNTIWLICHSFHNVNWHILVVVHVFRAYCLSQKSLKSQFTTPQLIDYELVLWFYNPIKFSTFLSVVYHKLWTINAIHIHQASANCLLRRRHDCFILTLCLEWMYVSKA